ncbi:MAG: hypothetical protein QOH92_1292 [Chloroflexota bacterium]|jgi:subtilase family serine protease|nr:hypothetical protein [Chloroflexota bacterium]
MVQSFVRSAARRIAPFAVGATALGSAIIGTGSAPITSGPFLVPLAIEAPDIGTAPKGSSDACTSPAPVHTYAVYHCYTPADIAAAYDIQSLHTAGNLGQGQTIVLVDSYGSPTAKQDLKFFHDTFYPTLPNPNFDQVCPLGAPTYNNTFSGNGMSGPAAAAGWSGEATLDIEWSYAVAPLAHIVLLAVPPAETEGVQGFPTLFNAIQSAINTYPAGTIFSQSFGVTEQTFGGAAQVQTAKFDAVYQSAIAKHDTVLASSGDNGSFGVAKPHRDGTSYSFPTDGWPASSPYLTSVGGTQLQYGWTWHPTTTDTSSAGYFAWDPTGKSEAIWNESWLPAATGGGPSAIYTRPSYQNGVQSVIGGNQRGVPDVSWNAAVNGGVLVYITAFPNYQRAGWHVYGGTSASSPQVAGVAALVNTARAAAGKGPIGFLNPALYQLGSTATSGFSGGGDFRDIVPQTYGVITLADNTLAGPGIPGSPTLTGYDMTTGFGSPRVANLVAALTTLP